MLEKDRIEWQHDIRRRRTILIYSLYHHFLATAICPPPLCGTNENTFPWFQASLFLLPRCANCLRLTNQYILSQSLWDLSLLRH